MNHLKKTVATFILSALVLNSYGGIGLGDWTCTTPNGNEIENNGGTYLYLKKNGQMLQGLKSWYFFSGYIIGQQNNGEYFVVNEKTSTIHTFQSEIKWNEFIMTHNLRPSLWKRWYDTDWEYFDDVLFIAIVFFYISIPLRLLMVWVAYKAIGVEKVNFSKPYTIVMTIVVGFVFVNFILEEFPQSW